MTCSGSLEEIKEWKMEVQAEFASSQNFQRQLSEFMVHYERVRLLAINVIPLWKGNAGVRVSCVLVQSTTTFPEVEMHFPHSCLFEVAIQADSVQ